MTKQAVHNYCIAYVNDRINSSQAAITSAQASANEEGKSSAGDKYETGRAMMQLEIEKNTSQLLQAKQLLQVLEHINVSFTSNVIQQGSLVTTDSGIYYISIGAGLAKINEITYYIISLASPIGTALKGKSVGEKINFNGKEIKVLGIE
jgi:transcription elongation GreA/GreB family factor